MKNQNKSVSVSTQILPLSQKKNNTLPESDDCCFLRFACGSLLPSFNFLLPSLCLALITSTWNSFYLKRGTIIFMSWFMQTQKTVTPDLFLLKLFQIVYRSSSLILFLAFFYYFYKLHVHSTIFLKLSSSLR